MAAFQVPRRHRPDQAALRLIPMKAPARPQFASPAIRARSEASPAAGASLTVAFLIAGAFIVAALTFWSGPDQSPAEGAAVEQAGGLTRLP